MNKNYLPETGFIRLPVVLTVIPVSKSGFYQGIREGKYPPPVKMGSRTSFWRVSDIRRVIEAPQARHASIRP